MTPSAGHAPTKVDLAPVMARLTADLTARAAQPDDAVSGARRTALFGDDGLAAAAVAGSTAG